MLDGIGVHDPSFHGTRQKARDLLHRGLEDRRISSSSPNADDRDQNARALSRHSGMPLAGIQSAAFLDSGQNPAGMTDVEIFGSSRINVKKVLMVAFLRDFLLRLV